MKIIRLMTATLLLLAICCTTGYQEQLMYARRPAVAYDTLAKITAYASLPPPPAVALLGSLCDPDSRNALLRTIGPSLAVACMANTANTKKKLTLTDLEPWLDYRDKISIQIRDGLALQTRINKEITEFRELYVFNSQQAGGTVLRALQKVGFAPTQPTASKIAPSPLAPTLSELSRRFETWQQAIEDLHLPTDKQAEIRFETAKQLALIVSGKRLVESAHWWKYPVLVDSKTSNAALPVVLSDAKKNAGIISKGLPVISNISDVLLIGGLLVLIALFITKATIWPWLLVMVFISAGALIQIDYALAYHVVQALLPLRQWGAVFNLASLQIWWPFAVFFISLIACKIVGVDTPWLNHLFSSILGVEHKSEAATRWWGVCAMVFLIVAATSALSLTSGALLAELMIFIGSLTLSLYGVRNATTLHTNGHASLLGWWLILVAVSVAAYLLLIVGDMGGFLLVSCLLMLWLFMFAPKKWIIAFLCITAIFTCAYLNFVLADKPNQLFLSVVYHLPVHLQERLFALRDSFTAASSDLARSQFLALSGVRIDGHGWGIGFAPFEGISPARSGDVRMPQITEDYIAAPLIATYGIPGLLMLGAYAAVAYFLVVSCIRRLHSDGLTITHKFVLCVAALGMLSVAIRVTLTTSAVLSAAPLTGVSAPLVSHSLSSALFAAMYFAFALWGTRKSHL